MKKYRIREKSIAWHIIRAKKSLQIIGMSIAILAMFTAFSAAAADDLEIYKLAYADAQSEEDAKTVEKVAETDDFEPETWDVPLEKDLQLFIADLCEEMSIEPELVLAMIEQESQWNPEAVGDGGNSLGLLQIQPRWHSARMDKLGCTDLFNPYENVKVAIDILAEKMAAGKGTEWALMAYNGGNQYANNLVAQGKVSGYAKEVLARAEEQYQGFDLLIAGSPCQSLSIVQSQTRKHLDGKSKLFFEFARAMEEVNPKFFLFENAASMNIESMRVISRILGCHPICINSNCFVAQDRPRYYWTNIPVHTLGLRECSACLQDIMETNVDESYFYSYPLLNVDMTKQVCATMDFKNNEMHKRIFNPKFKVHTLTCVSGGRHQKKVLVDGRARKLTPVEYERLQGLPDGYTEGVANTHRYTVLGNGWTVDVIAYIFKGLKAGE